MDAESSLLQRRRPFLLPKGFSLAELLMALSLFSFIILFSVVFLSSSQRLWRRVSASSDAGQVLRKAAFWVSRDLANSSRDGLASRANGNGGARLGDALWMLSAEDPVTGRFIRGSDGSPLWQKNVLFYLTVPTDHDRRYGVHCQNWDRVCPHKILLRKVIDKAPLTTPTSAEDDRETLLDDSEVLTYLTRPDSLELQPMLLEDGVVGVDYITGGLLDARAELIFSGSSVLEVGFVLEAPLLEDAQKRLDLGRDPFEAVTFTLSRRIAVLPIN